MIKNTQIEAASLGIFIFSTIAAFAAIYTGEGEEEIVNLNQVPSYIENAIN